MENAEVRFCSYCGTKLDPGAKFCKNCGKSVGRQTTNETEHETFTHKAYTERQTVYEGNLHKCPRCGEVLTAFVTNCPACGHEIRDTRSANSVRELASKLERIEARQMPAFEEKKSVMKMVFGRDFKDEDEADEARRHFETSKQQEKASMIINFSVPNTKEDYLEFMLLASSNIDVKKGTDDIVTKAWLSKLDQVYEKARLSMGNRPEFAQIKSIYDQKKSELKKRKRRAALGWVGGVAGWFFLLGLLWNPGATIAIAIGVVIIAVVLYVIFKKR